VTARPIAGVSQAQHRTPIHPASVVLARQRDTRHSPTARLIDDIRTGTHPGYDRLTASSERQPASIDAPPSGTASQIAPRRPGDADARMESSSSSMAPTDNTSTAGHRRHDWLCDPRRGPTTEDFEEWCSWAWAFPVPLARAFILTNPVRLVIDVQAGCQGESGRSQTAPNYFPQTSRVQATDGSADPIDAAT